jgi:hypothetical protein
MRVDNSTGKGTSGVDKLAAKFTECTHGAWRQAKLRGSLKIETQFLERLQSVSAVDGAAHTQKDDVVA